MTSTSPLLDCLSILATKQNKVAVIGTRDPTVCQRELAAAVSEELSQAGCFISTGAAAGIDNVAMRHAKPGRLKVYLPWSTYNVDTIPRHAEVTVYDPLVHKDWTVSVINHHPNPTVLTHGAFKLHARNYGIVKDCCLVIAFPYEKYGRLGGTGQGMAIAEAMKIPLVVVKNTERMDVTSFMGLVARELAR